MEPPDVGTERRELACEPGELRLERGAALRVGHQQGVGNVATQGVEPLVNRREGVAELVVVSVPAGADGDGGNGEEDRYGTRHPGTLVDSLAKPVNTLRAR